MKADPPRPPPRIPIDPVAIADFYQKISGQTLDLETRRYFQQLPSPYLHDIVRGAVQCRPSSREPGVLEKEDVDAYLNRRSFTKLTTPKPPSAEHTERMNAYRQWRDSAQPGPASIVSKI
jgi:hypothetical protein